MSWAGTAPDHGTYWYTGLRFWNGRVPKGELTADRGLYTVCLHLSTRVLWTNDNRRMTREAAIAACDAFVAGMVLRGEARVYP